MSRLARTLGRTTSVVFPTAYGGLINGCPTTSYAYVIGTVSSSDGGATWTAASGSVIGTQTGWASTYIKDPSFVWDGSKFTIYACGWNGSNFQVGRFTATSWANIVAGTITAYGSNPIFGTPGGSSWRSDGALFPIALYVSGDARPYKLWMAGIHSSVTTIGFLDSADGISFTDYGRVLDVGTGGSWYDEGVWPGAAIARPGGGYHLLFGGRHNATHYTHSGIVTCTDPTNSATYGTPAQYSNLTGDLTVGGKTWHSNQPHYIYQRGGLYYVGLDVWFPTSGGEEACSVLTTGDITSLPAPASLMIPINDGSWHANSAENPTALVLP